MSSEGNYRSHLTPETIRGYLGGRLDSTAMHQIETHLLECEFCSDAVEGFELYEHAQVRTEQTLLALRKDLNQKIREHKQPRMIRWPVWSAAAGIALAIAGYVVIKQQEKEQQLAAIRQSEVFLQTGVNDTLIIFMPEAPEPVSKEKFLAVNTPPVPQANASSGQAAVSALPDSPKAGDSVSVVLSARQKRAPITGSVAIRGLKKQAGQPPSAARVISGRVVTSDNSSLPGANVLVPGTGLGTATDTQGNFTLAVPDEANSLVVQMIGFDADTVQISDHADHLLLAMQPSEKGLEEVVVVGYSQKDGQVPPTPSIGKEAYEKYLSDSLRYPEEALRVRIEGEVLVGFTVRGSGKPAAFKVVRSLGYGCDQEAIRLIREGPTWVSPVSKRGRRHPTEAVQAVKFELKEKD